MTLIAPPRRLALLEEQQKQHEPAVLVIENPLITLSNNHLPQKLATLAIIRL